MKLIKIALFSLLSVSLVFAQNTSVKSAPANPKSSAPASAAKMPAFEVTEEDMAMIRMLLANDMFKNSFTEQCAVESSVLLGAEQAAKSCNCAYDRLIKNDKLLYALATTDNDDGFDKWGYEVIEPCLPEKFTESMGKAFVKQCVAESGENARSVCECTYNAISKKYTVKSLLKASFESPEKMQMELITMAGQCALQ